MNFLQEAPAGTLVPLHILCVRGYPARGSKPSEESSDGIPIIKVQKHWSVENRLHHRRDVTLREDACAASVLKELQRH